MEKTKIGIIGCGNISGVYFDFFNKFDGIEVAACADLNLDKAKKSAKKHGVPIACNDEELLNNKEIQIVVNLTIPKAHTEVSLMALNAGKHVHSEKPLAVTRDDGQKIIDMAKAKNLRVGCAPDTFLGGGIQTCRKLIDDGEIGKRICYAVSSDGINWEKPELGLTEFRGSKKNNLVEFDSEYRNSIEALLVLYDEDDPDPKRRFKLINEVNPFFNIAAFSPDNS